MQVNLKNLIDEVQWYQTVRELRWPDGVTCPSCQCTQVIKRGKALLHALIELLVTLDLESNMSVLTY